MRTPRFGIRGKFFVASLTLILSTGAVTGIFLETRLVDEIKAQVTAELTRHAKSARAMWLHLQPPQTPAGLARNLGSESHVRITYIAPSGRVVGDSSVPVEALPTLENHGNRHEVLQAVAEGIGVAQRRSTTVEQSMLYVALRLQEDDPAGGIVRASLPLDQAQKAVSRLRSLLVFAAVLGLGLAVALSGVASHVLSLTLRRLVRNAKDVATGTRQGVLGIKSSDEVGHLAGTLQALANELDTTVAQASTERDGLETILNSMQDGVLAVDETGAITLLNQTALKIFRLGENTRGQTYQTIKALQSIQPLIGSALNHQTVTRDFILKRPKRRDVLATATPLQSAGGAVIVLRDVTRLRRLEAIRRDFVANVSHELRTPISVVQANAETLLGGALDDPEHSKRLVEAIFRSAERLGNLVADLLDLSRIEAGAYPIDIKDCKVVKLASRVIDSLRDIAAAKSITLEHQLDPALELKADERALEQILHNLIENAIKYTPEGSEVIVRASERPQSIRLEVCDNGPGLENRHRKRVFQRFYRVDKGRSRSGGGTGLGLSIVKHLANAMSGTVGVDANAPTGSIFWLKLPRATKSEKAKAQVA